MRRSFRVLLCMSLAVCVCAVTASAAGAAAPEFGRCIKKEKAGGSGYSNSGCTAAVGSEAKFVWQPGPGPKSKFISQAREVLTPIARKCVKKYGWPPYPQPLEEEKELEERFGLTRAECERILAEEPNKTPVILETVEGLGIECGGAMHECLDSRHLN